MKCPLKYFPLVASLLFSLSAHAVYFIVTDTNDSTAATSLRGAIIAANQAGGNNTIDLWNPSKHSIYTLTITGVDEGAGYTGDLNVTRGHLTIVGLTNVTIDATGLGDRVFQVSRGASLTLENLIITGGTAPAGNSNSVDGEFGGAIENFGTLLLDNCTITNNATGEGYASGSGGDGGGIYNIGTLEAKNCIITGNFCAAGGNSNFGGSGGGIRNDKVCTLINCVISENVCGPGGNSVSSANSAGSGGNGGGIFNSGKLTLSHCIVDSNASGAGAVGNTPPDGWWLTFGTSGGNGGDGGGIYNIGSLDANFSSIYGNNAGDGGSGPSVAAQMGVGGLGGSGGGIFNAGNLEINISTISSNTCGNGGDSTGNNGLGAFSGATGGSGGGIYNSAANKGLKLTSCTITLNISGSGGNGGNSTIGSLVFFLLASGGDGGNGGGVLNSGGYKGVVVRNTIIAKNLVNDGGAPGTNTILPLIWGQPPTQQIGNPGTNGIGFDVCGGFISKGFNLIGSGDGGLGFENGFKADQVGSDTNMIDPLLGPLQMNGGFTPTHALLWGSPAVDQGKCFDVHQDQRGEHRPYNYSSIPKPRGGDNSDIGAFELDESVN